MRGLFAILAFALWLASSAPAAAQGCGNQNPNCIVPTRPGGDNGNAAASTAFVQKNALNISGLLVPFTESLTVSSNLATVANFGYNPIAVGLLATDSASCTCPTPGQNIPTLLALQDNFGGSNINNGRDGLSSFINLTTATSATNPYRFYVAGVFQANANVSDNGTIGTPAGELEGITTLVQLQGSATNWNAVVGAEHSMAISGTAKYKAALLLDNIPGDTSHGSTVDTLIWSYTFTGTVGFNTGWQIDANGGQFALASTGTVIKLLTNYTIGTGFDFGTGTVSGNVLQWASSAWSLAGNGNATLNSISVNGIHFGGPVTGTPVASICIDGSGNLFAKTSAGSCI